MPRIILLLILVITAIIATVLQIGGGTFLGVGALGWFIVTVALGFAVDKFLLETWPGYRARHPNPPPQ